MGLGSCYYTVRFLTENFPHKLRKMIKCKLQQDLILKCILSDNKVSLNFNTMTIKSAIQHASDYKLLG